MYIDYWLYRATTTDQITRLSGVRCDRLRLSLKRMVAIVGALAALVLFSPILLMAAETLKPPDETFPIRVQFRYFPRYNSNYFHEPTNKTGVFLQTLAANITVDLMERDTSTLTGGFQVARTFVVGVSGADSWHLGSTLGYKFHRNNLSLSYSYTPRIRVSDDPDAAGAGRSVNGIGLSFSRRWDRRLRTRLGYQFAHEDFSGSSERDSDIQKIKGDIRYRFHKLFTPGIGFELGFRRSGAGRSYNQGGPVLLVESRITKKIRANLRYRYRFRDYTTGDQSSSNFSRVDHRNDVRLRARYKLTDNWLPSLYFSYKNNDSSRAIRSYGATEVGLSILYRFP